MIEGRFVYWAAGDWDVIDGVIQFIPSIVVENQAGHVPCRGQYAGAMLGYWGETLVDCQEICDKANADLGYTQMEALMIVKSSMKIGKVSA